MSLADQWVRIHEREVAEGKHDGLCEWGTVRVTRAQSALRGRPATVYMCHCSKRHRESIGYTEPPGPVIHRAPICPNCFIEVAWDDGWRCDDCRAIWTGDTESAEFMDDYGDLGSLAPDEPTGGAA